MLLQPRSSFFRSEENCLHKILIQQKNLCELNSLQIGYAVRWTCRKKENGWLTIHSSAFGLPTCSSGHRIRDRTSKRVNCHVSCNTISSENALDDEDLIKVLSALADLCDAFKDKTNRSFDIFSIISSSDWYLDAYASHLHKRKRTVLIQFLYCE